MRAASIDIAATTSFLREISIDKRATALDSGGTNADAGETASDVRAKSIRSREMDVSHPARAAAIRKWPSAFRKCPFTVRK
jgi:hypothetical protein